MIKPKNSNESEMINIIDDEDSFFVSEFISHEYSEKTKSMVRKNAYYVKCAPCGVVLEKNYYTGSTLMFVKSGHIWLHYDDFSTIREKNRVLSPFGY